MAIMAYERTQARRIEAGLCKDCGAPRTENGTTIFCRPCADQHTARASARKAKLRAEWATGVAACNTCGKQMPDASYKNCEGCREQRRMYHHNHRKHQRAIRRGSGVCMSCNKPSTHSSNYCRNHWLENNIGKYGFKRDQYDAMWDKLERQDFRCHYTGVMLVPGVNASLDHRIPRSRGGDLSEMDNCVWCDRLINAFKNDLTESEFIERCRLVVERLG